MEKFYPIICGLSGTALTKDEKIFIQEYRPWGVILFERNCSSKEQLKSLTNNIKEIYGTEIPILIDQEGGRVSRVNYKSAFKFLSSKKLAGLRRKFGDIGDKIFYLNYKLLSASLKELGINVNTIPVLDIPSKNESGIIGDRSFSDDKQIVACYGSEVIDILNDCGIASVIKHIPGHGRADIDSHIDLPVINSVKSEMSLVDFYPFKYNSHCLLGMTAHIVYSDIDDKNMCTFSNKVISEIIRGEIGFTGTLMSDDISMKAIKLPLKVSASKALEAGCDIVLHCNGNINEMNEIARIIEKKHDPILHNKKITNLISKEVNIDTKTINSEMKKLMIQLK